MNCVGWAMQEAQPRLRPHLHHKVKILVMWGRVLCKIAAAMGNGPTQALRLDKLLALLPLPVQRHGHVHDLHLLLRILQDSRLRTRRAQEPLGGFVDPPSKHPPLHITA